MRLALLVSAVQVIRKRRKVGHIILTTTAEEGCLSSISFVLHERSKNVWCSIFIRTVPLRNLGNIAEIFSLISITNRVCGTFRVDYIFRIIAFID